MEFSKISWPSRLETIGLTVLVISMIAALTVVIFAYDTVFQFFIYGILLRR
jgi:preprotein translocase SecE subunit